MRKRYFCFGLLFLTVLAVVPMNLALASEVRTLELFAAADSFVSSSNPQSNFGKELYLRTEYENQKTIIEAASFDVPTASLKVMAVSLPKNGKITGSLEVANGGDINFRIKNADQTVTYFEEFSVKSLDFSFVAPYTGDYCLSFSLWIVRL